MSTDNTNEQQQPKPEEKTPEQLAAERLERYQKDPNSFVELSEVVLMAIRNPNSQLGISIMVGNVKRSELNNAIAELQHHVNKVKMNMDIESEMKRRAASELLKPRHGILNFARGKVN